MDQKNEKLLYWMERYEQSKTAYAAERGRMDRREQVYGNSRELTALVPGDRKREAVYVRNITSELIEAQVSSTIPQPKVTAMRPEDTAKAKLIEDMLRGELDRMPFEQLNDLSERTVPIQGGALYHVQWDAEGGGHTDAGELRVSLLHPKQVIPQAGVYSGVEEMDYLFVELPQTKRYIEKRYGVDVTQEREDMEGEQGAHESEIVTQCIAYYRNTDGGIGLYSWAGETQLQDLEDFQARLRTRCKGCGAARPHGHPDGEACPLCGGNWETCPEEQEELPAAFGRGQLLQPDGGAFMAGPGAETAAGSLLPARAPAYRPNLFPVVLQKNVSVYGKFLGDSDVDKIADQQNTVNRLEAKVIDKLLSSGSYITLPPQADIEVNAKDMKVIRLGSVADRQFIGVYDMEGSVSQDLAYLEQVYQEARQITGITDSFQGRRDETATSGKAKEFAAAQSAGRLESKRVMKNAAYAGMFEMMFKFLLAYMDEPRQVQSSDVQGNPEFKVFSRYDFLQRDAAGEWYWNDRFLFSCDTTAPLASNREAMWQETRMNFESGAFGDPALPETLVIFWKKMEMLHYPGAGETRAVLEERARQQAAEAAMQAKAMPVAPLQAGAVPEAWGQDRPILPGQFS